MNVRYNVLEPSDCIGAPRTDPWLQRVTIRIGATLAQWTERRRQRRQLEGMSDSLLKDIGLSRSDAHRESTKPFWVP